MTGPHGGPAAGGALDRLFDFIAGRAGLVLAVVGAASLAAVMLLVDFATGSLRIEVDPSLDPLVAPGDPERAVYDKVRWRFGNDEVVLVVLRADDALTQDMLARTWRLTRALRDLPGVESAQSITSVALPRGDDDQLEMAKVSAAELEDPQLPGRLRRAVADNPLVRGQLVSTDGTALAIALTLDPEAEVENARSGLYQRITALADEQQAPGIDVWVTGAPIVRAAIRDTVLRQLTWVVPGTLLLLTGFLALAFRTWRGVLVPVATIVLALLWTFAFLAVLGRPLNLITSLVPPLLATMGLAYCAHVLSEFEALGEVPAGRSRVAHLLHHVSGPVVLTGATTAIGLLAMAITDLPAIREFAYLSSLGVFFTAILVLTFVPAVLAVARSQPRGAALPGHRAFAEGSRLLGRFDVENRRLILFAASGVLLLAILAASRIQVGDQFVGVFEPGSRVRSDYEQINRVLGGVNSVSIQLDAGVEGAFTEPVNLRHVQDLSRWLAAQPEVGSVTTLVDHVWMLQKVLGRSDSPDLPSEAREVAQLLFFGDSDGLRTVVNGNRSATLLKLRLVVDDTGAVEDFLERLQPQLDQLPAPIQAKVTGNTVLLTRSLGDVVSGQLQSIGLALLLVYLCLALQFASLVTGLLAAVPTLLQTALYFGALGLSGVTLNATTSLVECLVLGLAVDDTIHYLARFNSAARRTGSESAGAVSALSSVLRPITLTKAILALGFLMLVTGELHNQVLFGWLAAVTLVAAWLVDVFVTPAFMSGVRVVTLWDTLLLDLGQNVQKTIPLFSGLSTRQARIFALMSDLRVVPSGSRVINEGDPGGDVFVVIEGQLAVWLDRDGHRVDISTVGRGAVLGEAGYFGQKRTANVDAVSPVRLLRFNVADQERICRQYPGIAARVFLNLNKIQAERRAVQLRQLN